MYINLLLTNQIQEYSGVGNENHSKQHPGECNVWVKLQCYLSKIDICGNDDWFANLQQVSLKFNPAVQFMRQQEAPLGFLTDVQKH